MDKVLFSEKEISAKFGISLGKLRNDRQNRQGMPYLKMGKTVRYDPADCAAYLKACRVDPSIPVQ